MRRPNLTDESAGERVWMPKYPTSRMIQAMAAEAKKQYPPREAREAVIRAVSLYPAMIRAEGESAFFVEGGE